MDIIATLKNDDEEEKIKKWAELADIPYNMGLMRSREAVLFQDILNSKTDIIVSEKENEVSMTQHIMDLLFNGDSPLVLIHNHSGTETCFSNRDIEVLLDYPRIQYMVVINSKQEIYVLGKTQQTKSRDEIMQLFWNWWANSEKSVINLKYKTVEILSHSPAGIHADYKEYGKLLKVVDEVIEALHHMTNYNEFLQFANNAGFYGAYITI